MNALSQRQRAGCFAAQSSEILCHIKWCSGNRNIGLEGGAVFTRFEDIDRDSFGLVSLDEVSRSIELERRAAAEKLEAEGHVRQELLMANLQAKLRSQGAIAVEQPEQLLRSVNRLFCENTDEHAFATLLYSEFDDRTRRLRYVNCGHLPGLLLQVDGTVEHLPSTAPVVGLFARCECPTAHRQLLPGDLLTIYTDGITESFNRQEEEFGASRLVDALWRHRHRNPAEVIEAVLGEVERFSPGEQGDDRTLIVARCRDADA